MNMFKVTNEVRGILLKSKEIVGYVEDKIFPVMAPENTAGDYIIYQRDGYKQEYSKMGVARQTPLVNVIAISEDYGRSQDLASLIYDSLPGAWTDPDMYIRLEDSTEGFIDNKYIQVLQFSISSL